MVDHSARAYVRMRAHQQRYKLSAQQSNKIDAVMARSYSDDADVRRGALSAPRNHFRPGQRDDEVRSNFVGMIPVL
jgi:hypothetical protein